MTAPLAREQDGDGEVNEEEEDEEDDEDYDSQPRTGQGAQKLRCVEKVVFIYNYLLRIH